LSALIAQANGNDNDEIASNARIQTALRFAAENGHADCVAALLRATPPSDAFQGADIAVHGAARNGHVDCLALLVEAMGPVAGCPLNAWGAGETPLMAAVSKGRIACARLRLPISDVNHRSLRDSAPNSALALAIDGGHTECVQLLLDAGQSLLNFFEPDTRGFTPLIQAAIGGHADIVELLLPFFKHTIDARSRMLQGTALMHAAAAGKPACVRKLLPLSDATAVDIEGRNALLLSVLCVQMLGIDANNALECIRALLPFCDALAPTAGGDTALSLSTNTEALFAPFAPLADDATVAAFLKRFGAEKHPDVLAVLEERALRSEIFAPKPRFPNPAKPVRL